MTTTLYILTLTLLCACLNRLRGTWSWFAPVYGLALASIVFVNTWAWQAWLVLPAFWIGESFGWGTLIGGVLEDGHDEKARNHLFLRGLIWWTPVCSAMVASGLNAWHGLYWLALAFPMSFQIAPDWNLWGRKNRWNNAEVIYGAAQGLIIGLLTGVR